MRDGCGQVGPLSCLLGALLATAAAGVCRADEAASVGFDPAALQAQAEAGDAEAQFKIGTLYHAGYGVTQDYLAARRWLQRAADRGYADAQCELGVLYQTSTYADTAPADLPDAVGWYAKAAAQENGCGQFALAALYDSGQGVPKDPQRAHALYAKAASHGYTVDKTSFPLQQMFGRFKAIAAQLAGVTDP
jgi:TPR repeat protein